MPLTRRDFLRTATGAVAGGQPDVVAKIEACLKTARTTDYK